MPELPEVELLVRHLASSLKGLMICGVKVKRARSIRPTSVGHLCNMLIGTKFKTVIRRGKYLLFKMQPVGRESSFELLGHLGMTGRMYLQSMGQKQRKHAVVVIDLGHQKFVFEDMRYFGRMTLDRSSLELLGPEPLSDCFNGVTLRASLHHSKQPIKVKLLEQSVVAGIGNIYASEALFRAGVSPRKAARRLSVCQCSVLVGAIRNTLQEAIEYGSSLSLDFAGANKRDGLFYFGRAKGAPDNLLERFLVYGRENKACFSCETPIRRIVQAARSTYFCPRCQRE